MYTSMGMDGSCPKRLRLSKPTRPAYKDFQCETKTWVNEWLADNAKKHLGNDIVAAYFDGELGTSSSIFKNVVAEDRLVIIERDNETAQKLADQFPEAMVVRSEFNHLLRFNPDAFNANLLYPDYMCTLEGNTHSSPLEDLSKILSHTKRDKLVLGMTFL